MESIGREYPEYRARQFKERISGTSTGSTYVRTYVGLAGCFCVKKKLMCVCCVGVLCGWAGGGGGGEGGPAAVLYRNVCCVVTTKSRLVVTMVLYQLLSYFYSIKKYRA